MEHWIEYVDVVLLALICVQFSLHRKRNEATLSSILNELQELKWQLKKLRRSTSVSRAQRYIRNAIP